MAIRMNGLRFMADFMIKGRRFRRQFPTQVEAAAWEAEIRRRDALKIPFNDIMEKETENMTFGLVLHKCFNRHWAGTKNEKQCLVNIGILEDFFGCNTPVSDIGITEIDEFIGMMKAKQRKPATVNQKLATLSKALTFAEERGYIDKKPKIQRQKVGNNARRRFFSADDEQKILEVCDSHSMQAFKRWVCWSIDTGMRPEETRQARGRDIRQDANLGWVIDINEVKDTAGTTEPRTIPLTSRALWAWSNSFPPLVRENIKTVRPFEQFDGKARQKCWKTIRAELEDDDPDFVPYTCRHTCATRLVQGGMNLKAVQQWMGHKDISMTIKYVKLVPSDLAKGVFMLSRAVSKFPPGVSDAQFSLAK